jgi:hypothetical protein
VGRRIDVGVLFAGNREHALGTPTGDFSGMQGLHGVEWDRRAARLVASHGVPETALR